MEYFSIEEIIQLMESAARLGVSVKLKDGEYSLNIDGIWRPSGAPVPGEPVQPCPQPGALAAQVPALAAEQPKPTDPANVVKSPIVGTFYASPAPDKPAFVAVGKAVKKGDVLFIVESMKLMNEVQSDRDGVVKEILIENGEAVEFGQPVLVLE